MTSPKVSHEAREAAALLAEASQVWCNIGGNDVAAIRNGYWDDSHDDIGAIIQAFAQFEQLIRSKVIDKAAGEGWQDIATAPKDGTAILIFQPNGQRSSHMPIDALEDGECCYRGDDPRLQWFDDGRFAIGYWRPWGTWGNRNSATVEPTHWRPLPAPPSIRQLGERGR